jgi:hypothetical protein
LSTDANGIWKWNNELSTGFERFRPFTREIVSLTQIKNTQAEIIEQKGE